MREEIREMVYPEFDSSETAVAGLSGDVVYDWMGTSRRDTHRTQRLAHLTPAESVRENLVGGLLYATEASLKAGRVDGVSSRFEWAVRSIQAMDKIISQTNDVVCQVTTGLILDNGTVFEDRVRKYKYSFRNR